jgi:subtilisin family serine protease
MKMKKKICVELFLLCAVLVFFSFPLLMNAVDTEYTKVMVKLDVKNIKKLTRESTRYKNIEPGHRFPIEGAAADLALKEAVDAVTNSVLHGLNGKGYRVNHTFDTLPYLALDVSPEAFALLSEFPEVLEITEDRPRKLVDYYKEEKRPLEKPFSPGDTPGLAGPKLDVSVDLIGAEDAWAMGYTGSGWYVAILDTGIRRTHQFFSGKTIVEACFSAKNHCPDGTSEDYGTGSAAHYDSAYYGFDHGTHVSGIAAGKYGSRAGVAKNSNIIAVQVFSRFSGDDCGGGYCVLSYDSDQVKGLEYVYSLRGTYSIGAVNMSLGGGYYNDYCDSEPQAAAIANLKAVRIATVIATGNDGQCGYVGSPSCISDAVAVGASDDSDEEAYFNNWHTTLQEFFAPGVSIESATGDSNSSYESWGGTSMATPHVTGAWALLRQAGSSSSVNTIYNALRNTGTSISSDWCSGGPIPRINVDDAISQLSGGTDSITVTSPNGGESWTAGSVHNITWTSSGSVGNVKIQYSTNNGGSWSTVVSATANDGSYAWTVPAVSSTQCLVRISQVSSGSPSDSSNAVFSITSGGTPTISLGRTNLYFTSLSNGVQTGSQSVLVNNSGTGTLNWSASVDASWISLSPASGTGEGQVTVSVSPAGLAAGSYSGVVLVSDSGATNSPQAVGVTLVVKNASQDEAPFGSFATPVEGSTVSSSVSVTGWVLDDVEVSSVKIYRGEGTGLAYIGDAVFVEGARPDVEYSYPEHPNNYKAGWGYMLLTHFLPGGGNGTYTLTAIAVDISGKQTSLGTKTITVDNASAVKPFGAVDLPEQGGEASGSNYRNSGWVLTPMPNKVPEDGSTIEVYVDGVYLGNPTYNVYRSDIAGLFPGYANSNGAHAYLDFDTTGYDNGVHSIYWTAVDNAGNADGIGSRFFTIQNAGGSRGNPAWLPNPAARGAGKDAACTPFCAPTADHDPVSVRLGYNANVEPMEFHPSENGIISIKITELERVEIRLFPVIAAGLAPLYTGLAPLYTGLAPLYTGYLTVGDRLKPLPVGSTLDREKGVFYWQPGPGFVGTYELVFVMVGPDGTPKRKNIAIEIGARF